MNGIHEVAGSIPAWSTNLRAKVVRQSAKRDGGRPVGPLLNKRQRRTFESGTEARAKICDSAASLLVRNCNIPSAD